jgi:hypothetical protein
MDAMFLLAAAAVATASASPARPDSAPARVAVEATASVRIVAGVRLKLDSPTNAGAPPAHDSTVNANGEARRARLIEFE